MMPWYVPLFLCPEAAETSALHDDYNNANRPLEKVAQVER
jgi:hypothetical protein